MKIFRIRSCIRWKVTALVRDKIAVCLRDVVRLVESANGLNESAGSGGNG